VTSADLLRRIAEREGWISDVQTSMGSWFVPYLGIDAGRARQLESYAVESLHCALTHTDRLIVLRAYGQACGYLGELRTADLIGSYGRYSDILLECRNRLEDWLRVVS
jgi:hypothetical protein